MKVDICKIAEYNFEEIYNYFSKYFEETNFWNEIEEKKNILIKPNMLGAFFPEKAVTTHPVMVDVIAKLLIEHDKKVLIGDSPGGTVQYNLVLKNTGIGEIADKYDNANNVNFSDQVIVIKTDNNEFPLAKSFMDADGVINLCKYKTHGLTLFTGAIKNLYGVIPGLKKADYHRKYPNPDNFVETVIDLYNILKPKVILNIMDGIIGMEGEGPSQGTPRNFGVIFTSKTASALDFVASKMMGFDSLEVPIIKKGLLADELIPENIDVDSQWENFIFDKVKIVNVLRSRGLLTLMPSFVKKIFRNYFDFYPAFTDDCKKCNICVDSCPFGIITLNKGDVKPTIDYSKCVKCLCCHEMCPHNAVYIKKTFLAKLFMK